MNLMNYTTDIPDGGKFTAVNDSEATEALLKAKDKEIHDLKDQVASLQRALAHNRDRDSVVDG